MWIEATDQSGYCLIDQLQPGVVVGIGIQFKRIHIQHLQLLTLHRNDCIAHHDGSGVNTKNYFSAVLQSRSIQVILCGQVAVLNKNIKLILNYVLGPLVFIILVYSIYRQVQQKPDWRTSLQEISEVFNSDALLPLVAVVCLMLLNWGLEARKWQLAVRKLQVISLARSFKAIFTGNTMAFFTPNRIGEYMGRMLYLKQGRRIESIAVTLVCSMAQLLITLVMGLVGLIFIRDEMLQRPEGQDILLWMEVLLYFVIGAILFVAAFYFRVAWLVRRFEKIALLGKFVRYIKVLDSFNATILWRILSLSGFRYLVFLLQYYLLFRVFDVDISWAESFFAISVVFLILAIVPSIAILSDLGIRWKASIELVHLFSANSVGILATSLAIWTINLVIPALMGSLLILGIKLFRNKPVTTGETDIKL